MAGGSAFGYSLLWVITLSTLILNLLQNMSVRLGIVTGKSLAENVRERSAMGAFASNNWEFALAILSTLVIVFLNALLLYQTFA